MSNVKSKTRATKTKADLERELEELKCKFDILINSSNNLNNSNTINLDDRVSIITYFLGNEALTLNKNEVPLVGLGAETSISIQESDDLARKYRNRIVCGLIEFKDNKWYRRYGINKPDILTDEYLINVLQNNNTLDIFNKLTNKKNKEYDIVLHQLIYRTVQLVKTHKVKLDYTKTGVLEKYFGCKFDLMSRLIEEKEKIG